MKAVSLEKTEFRKCGKSGCKRYQIEPFCSKHQQEQPMKYYTDKNIVPRSNPTTTTREEQAS